MILRVQIKEEESCLASELVCDESHPHQALYSFKSLNPLSLEGVSRGSFSVLKQKQSGVKKEEGHCDDEDGAKRQEKQDRLSSLKERPKCCTCKKTKCLKLYCECFAAGRFCGRGCNCTGCFNLPEYTQEREIAIAQTLHRSPDAFRVKLEPSYSDFADVTTPQRVLGLRPMKGCNCKQSKCLKKYCDCFQAGAKCSELCKCEGCKNCDLPVQDDESDKYKFRLLQWKNLPVGWEARQEEDCRESFSREPKTPPKQKKLVSKFNSFQASKLLENITMLP